MLNKDEKIRTVMIVIGLAIVVYIFMYIPDEAKPEHFHWSIDIDYENIYSAEYLTGGAVEDGRIYPGDDCIWLIVPVTIEIPEAMTATIDYIYFVLMIYDDNYNVIGEYYMTYGPDWTMGRDVNSTDAVKTFPLYFAIPTDLLDNIESDVIHIMISYVGETIAR